MQSNITQLKITGLFRMALMVFTLFCLSLGKINAQTYVNGNLSTGATAENGTAAPAGYTWSEVQHDAGNMAEANNTIGSGATGANSIADDFTVAAGQTWALSKVTVYGYSTNYAGATSPFTQLFVRIHSSNPLSGPTTIVFGDLTTNRMTATSDAMMYRISNTLVPAPLATNTARKIWRIEANIAVALPAGTYWLEYRMTAGALGNFAPHSTPLGIRAAPGSNAIQNLGGTWAAMTDIGFPATAPDVAVDMPFSVDYTVAGACTGTPNPGNTIAAPAAVCPNNSFVVSLQNNPAVSGLTYQWQSGPSATGPFTNIAGATGATYSAPTLAATTWFQAIVNCGAASDTSNPAAVNLNPPNLCYCTPPNSDCTDGDIITNVILGTLTNPSTCNAPSGYSNYTTNPAINVPNLVAGSTNTMQVAAGGGLWTEHVAVWIDYNQSGTFEASEFRYFGSTTGGTLTSTITVPTTATLGQTRMRVRVRFNTTLAGGDACLGYVFGETEDYTVNIVPCVQGVITVQPANASIGCSGNGSFSVTATGSALTYIWEYRTSSTGPWLLVPNAAPYSGVNSATLTITNAPSTLNGYQYRVVMAGPCTASDFSQAATLTVGPLVATVSPPNANICAGTITQLSITNTAPPSTTIFPAVITPLNIQIPDVIGPPASSPAVADAGINNTIPVTIPAGSIIANMRVRLNITHSYSGDLVIVLRAPNNQILNLVYHRSGTGTAGANFTNVVISSAPGLPLISTGTSPGYTGVYRPDAAIGAGSFNDPSGTGPTGFAPTVTTFPALYSVPTGNWTIAIQDPSTWGGDIGTLVNWSLEFDYGAPSTGIFAGGTGIFTDPAGTVTYDGTTPITTVYVNPTATTNYTVVVTNPLCTSGPTTIPVTVSNTLSGVTVSGTQTACFNGAASLTVSATAGNIQTVVWQVSTDGGNTWTAVANGGIYTGATTPTLTITGAPTTASGNMYRAIASNPCNSITSASTTLTVNPNPVIVVSANPFTSITPGMTTVLSAAVSPNAGDTYQWYLNGVLIPGATSATYTVDVDGLGDYTVVVTDVNGCSSTSDAITINDLSSSIVFIYPSPNTGQFQVRYHSDPGNSTLPRMLNVYDSKGSRVFSRRFTVGVPYERMDVDLRSHGKGIYQVELSDQNGQRLKTGRVVVL